VLVSNSELNGTRGGVSSIRFAPNGQPTAAYPILGGTKWNCAGGATPWGGGFPVRSSARVSCGSATVPPEPGDRTPRARRLHARGGSRSSVDRLRVPDRGRLRRPSLPLPSCALRRPQRGQLEAASVGQSGAVTWIRVSRTAVSWS
jgi:hypothetical protein